MGERVDQDCDLVQAFPREKPGAAGLLIDRHGLSSNDLGPVVGGSQAIDSIEIVGPGAQNA